MKYVGMPRMQKVCLGLLGVRVLFLGGYKSWKHFDFKMVDLWGLFCYFYISFVIIAGICANSNEGFIGVAFLTPSVSSF